MFDVCCLLLLLFVVAAVVVVGCWLLLLLLLLLLFVVSVLVYVFFHVCAYITWIFVGFSVCLLICSTSRAQAGGGYRGAGRRVEGRRYGLAARLECASVSGTPSCGPYFPPVSGLRAALAALGRGGPGWAGLGAVCFTPAPRKIRSLVRN